MTKKRLRKNKLPANLFDEGGSIDSTPTWGERGREALSESFSSAENIAGSVGAIGGALTSIIGAAKNNAGIKDTSAEEAEIKAQKGITVGATDKDSLMNEWGSWNRLKQNYTKRDVRGGSTGQRLINTLGATVSGATAGATVGALPGAIIGGVAGLGSAIGGWITGGAKARRKARRLNKQAREANEFALKSFDTRAGNLARQDSLINLANFSAFGGPLDFNDGAIDYEFNNRILDNKETDIMTKQRFFSVPTPFEKSTEMFDINTFAEGGPIHIKKANRGKFTEYCGGEVTDACIQRGKDSSSPTIRKRAVFAQNARKWHAFGGDLNTNGGEFSNGVSVVGNGGTHEQNPNNGVQVGVDRNGVPNLVEEGEVIYNDFVFSNRIPLPEELRKKYKLKGKTFANAAKALQKESQERPNDPISQRGLKRSMERLAAAQEELKAAQSQPTQSSYDPYESPQYAYGGNLFKGGGPYDIYAPESFSTFLKNVKTPTEPLGISMMPPAPDFNVEVRDSLFNPDTNIGLPYRGGMYDRMERGLPLPTEGTWIETEEEWEESTPKERQTWSRYAPIVGAGLGVVSDIFSRPDFSDADAIASTAGNLSTVKFNPIGNYLGYRPMDRDFYLNRLGQNAAATRRYLINNAGGNPAALNAALLAADYNYGESLGKFAREAEEYNQQQRERVEAFNRGTNQYNSEGAMRVAMANKQNEMQRFRALATAAQMRQAIKQERKASRSANLSALFQGLGDIGNENMQSNWLDTLARYGVLKMDTRGNKYTSEGIKENPARGRLKKKTTTKRKRMFT